MEIKSNSFIALSEIAIHNPSLQEAVQSGTLNAYNNRLTAMFAFGHEHGEALRQQSAEAKRRALRNLPELLEKAEANLQANGIIVQWAADADEANRLTVEIAKRHNVRSVVKGKSMLTEEIGFNAALQAVGIEVVETDLGEYIIQLNNEHPSHIIAPVMHKTKAAIRDIFVRKLQMTPTDDATEMVAFARKKLRDKFLNADMGVTGGNFIIAETGTVCLVMNEGNGRMTTTAPNVHVALVGIEKVVETVDDYATLTQTLPRSGTGQAMAVYTNMINGPRRQNESDGPEHVYVIFVDNGRSNIYATDYAEVLSCIRCGACQNACPVYRSTGGNAYGWVYGGPIGAVETPLLVGLDNAKPLPYASSLCGACKQACPVDIDLPRMLLDLRRDMVNSGATERKWNLGIKMWAQVSKSPRLFALGGKFARIGMKTRIDRVAPNPLSDWRKHRDFPDFAPKSFRQLWQERQKGQRDD
jgi:L-lactate dehydrogenase complex protein LldF